jgi:hypothetical protein
MDMGKKIILSEEQYSKLVRVIKENINMGELQSDSDSRMMSIINTLKGTINDIPNSWTSKKRESFIYDTLLGLPFLESAQDYLTDKNFKQKLKSIYFGNDPHLFTISDLEAIDPEIDSSKIYILHEPFGSKSSPDFLFITSKGLIGLEDKSSKNQKISFNTGTPGGNKVIMYYDRKNGTINLLTGKQWGWDESIENEFKKFTKDIRVYAKREFERRFGDKIKNMEFYARPMLVDKNKVKDIVDKTEQDVVNLFKKLI